MEDTSSTKEPISTTILSQKLSFFDGNPGTLNLIWDDEQFFDEINAQTLRANQKQLNKKFTGKHENVPISDSRATKAQTIEQGSPSSSIDNESNGFEFKPFGESADQL